MNIANLYRKLKQVLDDSNVALVNKGLNAVNNLYEIPNEIDKLDEINKLPYLFRKEIIAVTEEDLKGIIKIKQYAFYACRSLTSVTIPDSVTTIGHEAFSGCYNLTDVYLNSTIPPSLGNTNAIPTTTTIHVPVGSGDVYKNATNWSYHLNRIVEGG